MHLRPIAYLAAVCLAGTAAVTAEAQENNAAPAAPAAAATTAAPTSNAMASPAMAGPIAANPNPMSFDLGPLGKTYVTGAVSGIGFGQINPVPAASSFPSNRTWEADLSNGLVAIQKTDGLLQYFIQAGVYSLPAVGTPYLDASHSNSDLFGPVPQAYVKLVPNDSFSIEAGKLPTLIGEEYTFTFENLNIERGLLWNEENVFNRGVQLNYTVGPVALSLSWNDGFYSDEMTYLTGSATWTVTSADTLVFAGGGNTATTTVSTPATPGFLNNQQMYDISYTHTSGPWSINPYIQYTHVPAVPALGTTEGASTYGAAVLVNYSFDSSAQLGGMSLAGFSLPFRLEYIATTGSAPTAPNLLYGPGSKAWSATVTPTYQYKIFFARAELSYVGASSITAGSAFGSSLSAKSQFRGLVEAGFVF